MSIVLATTHGMHVFILSVQNPGRPIDAERGRWTEGTLKLHQTKPPTSAPRMSAQIVEMNDDPPKDTTPAPKAPNPITRNFDNDRTTNAIGANARLDEERIFGMVKESTVWDVYNNEARKVDNELVKDWTASLNFLLVFAAIFAAVLTAFIIESKKMLEPDQTQILVDITIQYFNSMGNQSRTNLTRPAFEPTSTAISINCCLFASLGASLIAALASVVALQWVADYDAAITRGGSSPEDRAKRRHFRHAGVLRWRMSGIIAALPLLLYSSVILFWAGAIQWMWELHHVVGYVVAGGTAIAVLFYTSTTLLGAIYVSSPFRTPLSRGLYWLPRWLLSLVGHFLLWVPIEGIRRCFTWPHRISNDPLPSKSNPASKLFATWVRKHLRIKVTSRRREDEAAKQDPAFQQDALAWLAEQLPISVDSHNRLLLFAGGMLALPRDTPLSPRFLETPWLAIIEFLITHYMEKIFNPLTSVEDCEGLDIALQLIDHPCIHTTVVPGSQYSQDYTDTDYWYQYPGRWLYSKGTQPKDLASMTFLLARDIPIPSLGSKYEVEAAFKLIRWRNSTDYFTVNSIWSEVFSDIQHYSPEFFESCLSLFQEFLTVEKWAGWLRYAEESLLMILEQALSRSLTIGEAGAIARAFTRPVMVGSKSSIATEKDVLIPQPLWYGHVLARLPREIQAMHHTITLLVARAAPRVSNGTSWEPKWVQWVLMMLWIGSPKEPGYWEILIQQMGEGADLGNLWDTVDMTMGGLPAEGPHIEEVLTLLVTLRPRLGTYSLGAPLWINSMDDDGKRSQAMRMLVSFDKIVVTGSFLNLHGALVGLISEDMQHAGIRWPSARTGSENYINSSNDPGGHLRQLAHIKDPCFALMGAFAYGIPRADMLTWTNTKHARDDDCLQALHSLVFKELSVNDLPALWEFRAAMGPFDHTFIEKYFFYSFFDPEMLACLELLLQYRHGHSTGLRRLLFHLDEHAASIGFVVRVEAHHFMKLGWKLHDFNLILAMLGLCDTHELSDLDLTKYGAECAQRIWEICKAVKRQPAEFFCLLVDIVTDRRYQRFPINDMVILLESVRQASTFPEDETTTPLLRPLSLALQEHLGRTSYIEGRLEDRELEAEVAEETRRICDVLDAKSTKTLIRSSSHLRMLSCAHSAVVAQPAIWWLRMHVEL